MTGCYLTSLPFEFMRSSADFDPDWPGSYFIPRDTVKPPASLLRQLWPHLERWKAAHESDSPSVEHNMAAEAFLDLLGWLREVLLQDSVTLRKRFPSHPIFKDPVFHCAEYLDFAARVEVACANAEADTHVDAIERVIPAVADKLRTIHGAVLSTAASHERSVAKLAVALEQLTHRLDNLPGVTIDVNPVHGTVTQLPSAPPGELSAAVRRPTSRRRPTTPRDPPALISNGGIDSTVAEPSPRRQDAAAPSGLPVPAATAPADAAAVPPTALAPRYVLSREIRTVKDLWTLWRLGGWGMPSVEKLEHDFGASWRPASEKTFFHRRKVIVDEISRRAALRRAVPECIIVDEMDLERAGQSLEKLQKAIKERRKVCESQG